ncbi:MAG: hypothetical protein KC493_15170 [Bacteriovoracaceae bacterium]|nr:hypothetical protein [Bacteriovoracaceae bacterium]
MKKILLTLSILMLTTPSFAGGLELSNFIKDELKVINLNLEDSEKSASDSHQLSKVRVRVRGKAGIEVPFLAKFELKPIVEFHFKKK